MVQVAWISTGDARRAIEWALETWDPVLDDPPGTRARVVLAPWTGAGSGEIEEELIDELVARLRHRTARPVALLVARDTDRTRGLRNLSARLGVELRSAESFADDERFEIGPGLRAPGWLQDAFVVEIASAELAGPRPESWFLDHAEALLRAEDGAASPLEALRLFRPQLLIWDAIGVRWPGARRPAEFLAISDHRLALERTAHAIYSAFEATGGWSGAEARNLPSLRRAVLAGEDPGDRVTLVTEGRTAQQLRRRVESDLAI